MDGGGVGDSTNIIRRPGKSVTVDLHQSVGLSRSASFDLKKGGLDNWRHLSRNVTGEKCRHVRLVSLMSDLLLVALVAREKMADPQKGDDFSVC